MVQYHGRLGLANPTADAAHARFLDCRLWMSATWMARSAGWPSVVPAPHANSEHFAELPHDIRPSRGASGRLDLSIGALARRWHDRVGNDEVKRMTPTEHVPADFVSTFRRRFAPLFGRKIGRQRAEQYLGGLLGGRAERRNVTSLAGTIDGATARALGWLLNKSPWPTRPIVDAPNEAERRFWARCEVVGRSGQDATV